MDDVLTEEEILDLAQRIKIADLILDGKTYEEISKMEVTLPHIITGLIGGLIRGLVSICYTYFYAF